MVRSAAGTAHMAGQVASQRQKQRTLVGLVTLQTTRKILRRVCEALPPYDGGRSLTVVCDELKAWTLQFEIGLPIFRNGLTFIVPYN